VGSRIGRHVLEPAACAALTGAAALGSRPGALQPFDQVVPDLLELGHVRHVALRAQEGVGWLAGLSRIARIGGELRLQARDLATELPAAEALIARDLRDVGCGGGWLRRHLLERSGCVARGVDGPCQVARIDAAVPRAIDRLRREALQVGIARGVVGHEGAEPVPRGDQPLLLEAPVHGPRGVDVDSGAGRELPHPGETVAGRELAARDQNSQPPGELCAQREVVGTREVGRPERRLLDWLRGLCH
jgi:hypothetical protein